MELKLLYPGDQLDFWKLLVAKALEGPGLGHHGEFSKLLEKPLGTQFVGSLTSFLMEHLFLMMLVVQGQNERVLYFGESAAKVIGMGHC